MNWKFSPQDRRINSECYKYRIINNGAKGGERYMLITQEPLTKTWCKILGMGTLTEMKEKQI